MPFNYDSILVIGATSGIGYALAERFLAEGKKVIVVGRRKNRLDEFVEKYSEIYGKDKVASYVFDITKLDEIAEWTTQVTKEHPDLDAVFVNSGIQRGFNFSKPETVDLKVIEVELTTNYTSYIYIAHAFLPFLLKKKSALVFSSSGLAIVPIARCPNYCATKAALHHFLISLRIHLKDTSVEVLEIIPPAVQTELHDKEFQPDIENGREIGIPLKDFVEETYQQLTEGNAYGEFPIGPSKGWYAKIEPARRELVSLLPQSPANT